MTYKINYKRYSALVRTLANCLHYNMGLNWSEAMTKAHATIKDNPTAFVIRYFSKSAGKVVTRVITKEWTKFVEPKNGSPRPTLLVHADLQYIALDKYPTRSAVRSNVKEMLYKVA